MSGHVQSEAELDDVRETVAAALAAAGLLRLNGRPEPGQAYTLRGPRPWTKLKNKTTDEINEFITTWYKEGFYTTCVQRLEPACYPTKFLTWRDALYLYS